MPTETSTATQGRGDATRQRIIELAAPIFNKHGYAGTSMSELMEATGLEKGGIYRHFKSKQSLASAAFDHAWNVVFTERQRGLDECSSPLEKLLLFVRNFVEESPRKLPGGCPLLNTAIDSDDGDPLLRRKVHAAMSGWQDRIIGFVSEGQECGELRQEIDPRTVAVILISALEGAIMMSRLERSREPLRQVGEHLTGYLQSLQQRNRRSRGETAE